MDVEAGVKKNVDLELATCNFACPRCRAQWVVIYSKSPQTAAILADTVCIFCGHQEAV